MLSMNLTRLELRHLRYFLAVADSAHFTKAAAILHVTQPTLSHQIRQLEDQLGLPLFDRVGRRVRLTAAGELLLPHARRVLRQLEEAESALGELLGLKRGVLKVGIVQTVNACVIPEIVGRFSKAHPGIQVACSEMAVDEIETGLEAGRLDVGIGFLPPLRKSLQGEVLFAEELVAVVSTAHPLAKHRQLRVRDVAKHPLVLLSPKYCTRQLIDDAFTQARARPNIQIEMNSIDSILSTVREANLATLLPSLALCQRDLGFKAIRVTHPTPKRSVGLLWAAGAQRRLAAKAFATVTDEVLADRKISEFRINGCGTPVQLTGNAGAPS
jgi:LysR family transcriptional regulator, cyn operon transcriptional activator